jgi:hypothetical protein
MLYIASNMNYVLDTKVLVAAVRSPAGASAELLRRALNGQVSVLCSVPLFLPEAEKFGVGVIKPRQYFEGA